MRLRTFAANTTSTTKYIKRAIVIITAGQKIAANTQAKKIDPGGGDYAWTRELSPSGKAPATHYWNNWQMMPEEMIKLKADLQATIPGFFQWFELSSWDPAIAKPSPAEVLLLSNPPLKVIETSLS